eukprot:g5991.t1
MLLCGVDPNIKLATTHRGSTERSTTALHMALASWTEQQLTGHGEKIEPDDNRASVVRLLARHARLDPGAAAGKAWDTALWRAVHARNWDAAEALVLRATSAGGTPLNVSATDARGRSALHAAADASSFVLFAAKLATAPRGAGQYDSARGYGMSGVSAMLRDSGPGRRYDHARLTDEVHAWNQRFVDLLLQAGADPNATDAAGQTPLHVAVQTGNRAAAAALVAAGAAPAVLDGLARNASALASFAGFDSLARELGHGEAPVTPPRTRLRLVDEGDRGDWNLGSPDKLYDPDTMVCDLDVVTVSGLADKATPESDAVYSVNDLAREAFTKLFVARQRPALIRDAIWSALPHAAMEQWGVTSLGNALGKHFEMNVERTVTGRAVQTFEWSILRWLFETKRLSVKRNEHIPTTGNATTDVIVEKRWAAHAELHRRALQLRNQSAAGWLEGLVAERGSGWSFNNYQLNVGLASAGERLRYRNDAMMLWAQPYGRTRWVLLPPPSARLSTRHFADDLDEARAAEGARECVLQSGDVLFVPPRWAYGAVYERNSVGISFHYHYTPVLAHNSA